MRRRSSSWRKEQSLEPVDTGALGEMWPTSLRSQAGSQWSAGKDEAGDSGTSEGSVRAKCEKKGAVDKNGVSGFGTSAVSAPPKLFFPPWFAWSPSLDSNGVSIAVATCFLTISTHMSSWKWEFNKNSSSWRRPVKVPAGVGIQVTSQRSGRP